MRSLIVGAAAALVILVSVSACGHDEKVVRVGDVVGETLQQSRKHDYTAQFYDLTKQVTGKRFEGPDEVEDPSGWSIIAACDRDSVLNDKQQTYGIVPVNAVTTAVREKAKAGGFDRLLTCP